MEYKQKVMIEGSDIVEVLLAHGIIKNVECLRIEEADYEFYIAFTHYELEEFHTAVESIQKCLRCGGC